MFHTESILPIIFPQKGLSKLDEKTIFLYLRIITNPKLFTICNYYYLADFTDMKYS